jgi:hypothetical protein
MPDHAKQRKAESEIQKRQDIKTSGKTGKLMAVKVVEFAYTYGIT